MTDIFHAPGGDDALAALVDRVYALLPEGANCGQISRQEAEFLADRVLLEVGTAAGVSAAVMYGARKMSGGDFRLHAVECLDHCYFDASKKPGFVFREAHPGPAEGFSLHIGADSFDLETVLAGDKADLAFIDGNHPHPWATIDTILALPFLAPQATLVYHDTNLHQWDAPTGRALGAALAARNLPSGEAAHD